MTIFPTWYTSKWSADSMDQIWSSDGVTNFNITVDEIGDEVFTDRSTTDLVEGTNEYYTDARVDANATVIALWTDKADKTNVLELDNTTSFTPDADYEPATKKYVDDNIVSLTPITIFDTNYETELASKVGTDVTVTGVETTVITFTTIYAWDIRFNAVSTLDVGATTNYKLKVNGTEVEAHTNAGTTDSLTFTITGLIAWDIITYTILMASPTTLITSTSNLEGGFIFSPSFT